MVIKARGSVTDGVPLAQSSLLALREYFKAWKPSHQEGYLFWEGNKRIDWRFDSGFVVAGADTGADTKSICPYNSK